jgi:hypothetical protein
MIEATGAFLAKDRKRAQLERYPLLTAMVPALTEAHEGMLAGEKAREADEREAARARLYQEGVATDARHDRKGAGAFHLLGAMAMLTDDPARETELLDLRRKLFPEDNLKVLKTTWRGEAGNALRLREKVLCDEPAVATMRAIPTGDGRTLLDAVNDFVAAGERLGAIEDRRLALAPTDGPAPATSTRLTARNRWVNVVSTMVLLVDDVLRLDAAARAQLLGGLEEAERKADARAAARRAANAKADKKDEPDADAPARPAEG